MIDQQKKSARGRRPGASKSMACPQALCVNPYNGERVPIWVATNDAADHRINTTGAIMMCPCPTDERRLEFAIRRPTDTQVIKPTDHCMEQPLPFCSEEGVLINSGAYDGLSCEEAQKRLQEIA